MAREIRVVRKEGARRRGRPPKGVESGDGHPAVPGHVEPRTTEEARHAIELTRGRISSTLDAIEGRVGMARREAREQLDVVSPLRDRIRDHPEWSLAIALGTGLFLALVTGRTRRPVRVRTCSG